MKTFGAALLLALGAEAHITLWHPSLFGFNWPDKVTDKQNYNTNYPVAPLRGMDNLTVDRWFGHEARNLTPADGQFLELKVGQRNTFELACNRAFTSYGDPNNKNKATDLYACQVDNGPLHNKNALGTPYNQLNLTKFGGTALGIAYTDNFMGVTPNDFAIISVNYTSPWFRLVDYQIPKDLPPCPEKGCLCSWNWIHTHLNGEGYGKEFYNTLYRCNVTGDTANNVGNTIAKPQVPVKCQDSPDKCVTGPKQGMFLWMVNGNNMEVPDGEEPTYNLKYGFKDGAQDDAIKVNAKPPPSSSAASASAAPAPASSTSQATGATGATAPSSPASGRPGSNSIGLRIPGPGVWAGVAAVMAGMLL